MTNHDACTRIVSFTLYLPPPQLISVGIELNGSIVCIFVASMRAVGPIAVCVPGQDHQAIVSDNFSEYFLLLGGPVLQTGPAPRPRNRVGRCAVSEQRDAFFYPRG